MDILGLDPLNQFIIVLVIGLEVLFIIYVFFTEEIRRYGGWRI